MLGMMALVNRMSYDDEQQANVTCSECGAPMYCDSCDEDGDSTRKTHHKDSHLCSKRCYQYRYADEINEERREREYDEVALDRQMRAEDARAINSSHARLY